MLITFFSSQLFFLNDIFEWFNAIALLAVNICLHDKFVSEILFDYAEGMTQLLSVFRNPRSRNG